MVRKKQPYDEATKRRILELVKNNKAKGISVEKTLKSQKLNPGTYYNWLRGNETTPKKRGKQIAQLLTMNLPNDNDTILILMGRSMDLTQALDRLAEIKKG